MKNLYLRSIFGTLFLVVTVGCLLCAWAYAVLMLFALVACCVELYNLLVAGPRYRKEKICVAAASFALFALSFCHCAFGLDGRWIFASFLPVVAAFILCLKDCERDYDFNGSIFLPIAYVGIPLTSTLLLTFVDGAYTWKIILGIFILIWCNDVGAYCFGTAFGQRPTSRKLAPAISPKKSWIGVAGGTVCSLLAAWAVWSFFGNLLPLAHWFVIAVIVSVIGVCGDLFESLLKRHAGVKDSGNIIPGHGGMLDRFDDVLILMPVIAIYLKLFNLI